MSIFQERPLESGNRHYTWGGQTVVAVDETAKTVARLALHGVHPSSRFGREINPPIATTAILKKRTKGTDPAAECYFSMLAASQGSGKHAVNGSDARPTELKHGGGNRSWIVGITLGSPTGHRCPKTCRRGSVTAYPRRTHTGGQILRLAQLGFCDSSGSSGVSWSFFPFFIPRNPRAG